MKSELSGIFRVKVVAKNISLGNPVGSYCLLELFSLHLCPLFFLKMMKLYKDICSA